MGWMLLLLWLITWLLCWTSITTGSTPANIFNPRTIVRSGLLSLGVVCVLFAIIVLAAKIFLWIIVPELVQILQHYLDAAIVNSTSGLTRTSIGIRL